MVFHWEGGRATIEPMDDSFLPVPGWAGFRVSARGLLMGPSGFLLKPSVSKDGHLYIVRRVGGRTGRPQKLWVHRAVLLCFIGPCPVGHESRHLDGNPAHNTISNLAWGTRLENMRDKQRHGTERHGEDKPGARLTAAEVHAIRADRRPARTVATEHGVNHTAVLRIRRRERWRRA